MKRGDYFKGSILINPLLQFKDPPSRFEEMRLKALRALQFRERQAYPKMDKFLPEELRRLRENLLDFYVEPKMNVESYL